MAIIQMFPDAFIALQEEMLKHPDIMLQMQDCPHSDFPNRVGYVAGLLNIAVDGYYTYGEIEDLAKIVVKALQEKRTLLILPSVTHSVTPDTPETKVIIAKKEGKDGNTIH